MNWLAYLEVGLPVAMAGGETGADGRGMGRSGGGYGVLSASVVIWSIGESCRQAFEARSSVAMRTSQQNGRRVVGAANQGSWSALTRA